MLTVTQHQKDTLNKNDSSIFKSYLMEIDLKALATYCLFGCSSTKDLKLDQTSLKDVDIQNSNLEKLLSIRKSI